MAIVLNIDGTDRDGLLASIRLREGFNGIATLESEIDSVDSSYRPDLYDEVVLLDGAEYLFGGLVVDNTESGLANEPIGASITNHVSAQGYLVRAERAVANGVYPEGTLKSKLLQLLADTDNPLPWITLHGSQADGPTLPEETFDYVKTKDVLDQWALLSGWPYEIDETGVLRYVEPGTLSADFNIVDGDGNTVGDITVTPTHSEYYNRIIVRAGTITALAEDIGEIDDHGLHVLVVQAPPETTQEGADALAAAILQRSLPMLKQLHYFTFNRVKPGRAQHITLVDRNVNNDFLIGDVETFIEEGILKRSVTAVEGLVYQTGWREQFKKLLGAGGSTTTAGFVGGGGTSVQRFAYPLSAGIVAVKSPTAGAWVPSSEFVVQINTVPRGTLSALVVVRLRALSAGVGVQARIFDVTDNAPCPGVSAVVTSQTFQLATFTATLTAGSHYYRLEHASAVANEGAMAVGYLE